MVNRIMKRPITDESCGMATPSASMIACRRKTARKVAEGQQGYVTRSGASAEHLVLAIAERHSAQSSKVSYHRQHEHGANAHNDSRDGLDVAQAQQRAERPEDRRPERLVDASPVDRVRTPAEHGLCLQISISARSTCVQMLVVYPNECQSKKGMIVSTATSAPITSAWS